MLTLASSNPVKMEYRKCLKSRLLFQRNWQMADGEWLMALRIGYLPSAICYPPSAIR